MGLFSNRLATKEIKTPRPPQTPSPTKAVAGQAGPAPETYSADTNYVPPPEFVKVRQDVQEFLVNEIRSLNELAGTPQLREVIDPIFTKALASYNLIVSRSERANLFDLLVADIFGLWADSTTTRPR